MCLNFSEHATKLALVATLNLCSRIGVYKVHNTLKQEPRSVHNILLLTNLQDNASFWLIDCLIEAKFHYRLNNHYQYATNKTLHHINRMFKAQNASLNLMTV